MSVIVLCRLPQYEIFTTERDLCSSEYSYKSQPYHCMCEFVNRKLQAVFESWINQSE